MAAVARCVFVFALALSACQPADRSPPPDLAHDNLNATLWMQCSAEYETTTRSLFQLARVRLEEALRDPNWTAIPDLQPDPASAHKLAIIVDADETVIDNLPYQARCILADAEFETTTWYAWCREVSAGAVPGAKEFLAHTAARGVEVFYITNRDQPMQAATIANLARLGFPNADAEHVLVRYGKGDPQGPPGWDRAEKGPRRAHVARTHRVLLLLGDNLGDFLDGVQLPQEGRARLVQATLPLWGERWIMLPNASYGSWEDSLYGFDRRKPKAVKRAEKRAALRTTGGAR